RADSGSSSGGAIQQCASPPDYGLQSIRLGLERRAALRGERIETPARPVGLGRFHLDLVDLAGLLQAIERAVQRGRIECDGAAALLFGPPPDLGPMERAVRQSEQDVVSRRLQIDLRRPGPLVRQPFVENGSVNDIIR